MKIIFASCTNCGFRTSDLSTVPLIHGGCSSCSGRKYRCTKCGARMYESSVYTDEPTTAPPPPKPKVAESKIEDAQPKQPSVIVRNLMKK